MNKYRKRYREYRRKTQEYEGDLPYTESFSGFLFHSKEELNKFTNCDDLFSTDISV